MQSRKTLLFHEKEPWVKRSGKEDFDVPMGCFDGAEVCELVGSYLLNELKNITHSEKLSGLYRDDGLGIFHKLSGPQTEQKRKSIVKLFKNHDLSITISTNLDAVDFLDVHLDLKSNTFKPYMKPNNTPVYIHSQSTHPNQVIKQLPLSINKRISDLCSSKEVYDESIGPYKDALNSSGFNIDLNYAPTIDQNQQNVDHTEKKKRKRKIIWFNPPFSKSVETNVGKIVLKLVKKHFPKTHVLHKVFNKNTVKVSYSCMPNVSKIISGHNKKMLNPVQKTFGCNCRIKNNCPLENHCLTPSVVYEARVTNNTNTEEKIYVGATATTFKERYSTHMSNIRLPNYRTITELSNYAWKLKDEGIVPIVNWKIIKKVNSTTRNNYCRLCLNEKLLIINSLDDPKCLNTRDEFISKCRHERKMLIKYS